MTARTFLAKQAPAYMFQFGYVPVAARERARYGAGHGSDISFVFNTLNARWGGGEATPDEKELARIMNTYWTNFAKTGNPNGKGVPNWPMYDNPTPGGMLVANKAYINFMEGRLVRAY